LIDLKKLPDLNLSNKNLSKINLERLHITHYQLLIAHILES